MTVLAEYPGMQVMSVACGADHAQWSPTEVHDDYRLVLVRRGRFGRWAEGEISDLDRTQGYVGVPGEEERFTHPAGGDECTALRLAPARWRALVGERPVTGGPFVYVGAKIDFTHRRLLAATRSGDTGYAVAESVGELLRASTEHPHRPTPSAPTGRAVVAQARDAIISDDPASGSLVSLADTLHVSPGLLSRYFSRVLGMSVTRYRNSVRVGRALDRLVNGEESLAMLSSDLGFADQAHLCRTVRAHLGYTPSAVRRVLGPSRRSPR